MANATVTYGQPSRPQLNSVTQPATLTTSEADLFIIKDYKDLQKSQLTIYGSVTLGGVTSATFYYYYSTDNGTTWFPVCLYNTTSGEITQRAVLVDSGTYAAASVSYFADNHALGAANAFKVTGKSSSSTPAYTLSIMTRDN